VNKVETDESQEQSRSDPIQSSLKTLIFDLDGVITSETRYWNTARLTVWELIESDRYLGLNGYFSDTVRSPDRVLQVAEAVIAKSFIYQLKSRAVNSNWDLTFFVFCLHLIGILKRFSQLHPDAKLAALFESDSPISDRLQYIGQYLKAERYTASTSDTIIETFWQQTRSLTGSAVLDFATTFAAQVLGTELPFILGKGELWQLCYDNFQDWYEGKKGYTLPDDETVLERTRIDDTLQTLTASGRYTLAIATGRPRNEVLQPLTALGLLPYFDPERIVTYDEVLAAESVLAGMGQAMKLGKPHPFVLFKALYPDEPIENVLARADGGVNRCTAAYIGDAASDVVAAKQAGCLSIGVLTGFSADPTGSDRRTMLESLACDVILKSILELPQWLEGQVR